MKQTFSSSFSRAAFLLLLMLFIAQAVWADDIVITSANFTDYFDYNSDFQFRDANSATLTNGGYFLKATVAAESTLDFQGEFVPDGTHKPRIFINKRVNITSSDKSAIFKNGATSSYWMFCMLEGADYTEVKNLKFSNACLYVNDASYVTIDGIDMEANVSNIGSGTGFLSVYSTKTTTPSDHVTIKNSHIVNGGTGSATVVIGNGGLYAVVDKNVVEYTGSGLNMLFATTFVGTGDAPKYVKFTNNELNNPNDATSACWAIVVCAAGSLVEGNTVNYKGNGITTQFGSPVGEDDDKVVYRNNTINNGGSMSVFNYSVVENNYVSGTLTISQGATATCNTASKLVVSGRDAIVQYNIAYGDVDINSSAINTLFTGNAVNGTLSLKGSTSNNTITGNAIISSATYAISRTKTLTGNRIEGNMLISSDKQGDEAVDPAIGSDNTIQNNTGGTVITSETSSMTAGDKGTFYYVPANTSVTIPGSVSVTGSAGQSVNIILFTGATLTINGISYGTGYNAILIANEGATGEYWTTYYNGVKSFVADANTTVYQASVNSGKTAVVLTEVTGREIPAGKGVVLKSTSTTIMLTPAATTQTLDGNELQGSDVDLATPTNAYCLSKETTRDGGLTPRGVGFYTYTLATIPAHRAYLVVEGGPNPARGFLGFGDDDNTTGISLPEAVIVETDGPIYDLSGRRVTGQPHKGIYVKDGKKFVIK